MAPRPVGSEEVTLPSESERWVRLETPRFTVLTPAPEATARRVASSLEDLEVALAYAAPALAGPRSHPTWVFVLPNQRVFERYSSRAQGREPDQADGFYLQRRHGAYVVMRADSRWEPMATVRHEWVHDAVATRLPEPLPPWLNEGLAEYFSTVWRDGRAVRLGRPSPPHVRRLQRRSLPPLADVIGLDAESLATLDTEARRDFYAQSWLLVHRLRHWPGDGAERLSGSLEAIAAGADPAAAVATLLDADVATLERQLRSYVERHTLTEERAEASPPSPERNPSPEDQIPSPESPMAAAEPMAREDVLFHLGDLLLAEGRRDEAETHFEAALALNEHHAAANAAQSVVLDLAGRRAEATELCRKAVDANTSTSPSTDAVALCRCGVQLGSGRPSAEDRARAREALERCVALRPGFGDAWASLGSVLATDQKLERAVAAHETAYDLLPRRAGILRGLVQALVRSGDTARAWALVERRLASGADSVEATALRELLLREEAQALQALVDEDRLKEAVAGLERIAAETESEGLRRQINAQLEELRGVLAYNRFIDDYDAALALVRENRHDEARRRLEALVDAAPDNEQRERVRRQIEELVQLEQR